MIDEYLKYLNEPILEDHIFIESFIGALPDSEMLKAIQYLIEEKPQYKLIVSIRENLLDKAKENKILKRVHKIVARNTIEYVSLIATCKYLINDVTFPPAFAKRDDQVYFNIWHGTPIKKLGFSSFENNEFKKGNFTFVSNVNKNIRNADKVVVNNSHLEYVFMNEYGVKNHILENDKILRTKYLKDEFFEDSKINVKKENSIVIAYTWKDSYLKEPSKFINKLKVIDSQIQSVGDDMKGYVFIHHTMISDDFIKEFNSSIKKLEIVVADNKSIILAKSKYFLTDYSSLIFDAMKAGSKTIIDITEHDDYVKKVGIYEDVFSRISSPRIDDLNMLKSLLNGDFAIDNSEPFISYEKGNENWIDQMLSFEHRNKSSDLGDLIYPGSLLTNGITSSFYNVLGKSNLFRKQLTIIVNLNSVDECKAFEIKRKFSKEFDFIFIKNMFKNDKWELSTWKEIVIPYFKKMFFGRDSYRRIIHYSGYDALYALLFDLIEAKEKVIYMHNDMELEHKFRKNFIKEIIFDSYKYFDKIICVSKALMNVAQKSDFYSSEVKGKMIYIPNPLSSIDYYREESLKSLDISKLKYGDVNQFVKKFSNKKTYKVTMLSRISYEKNNLVAIEAFEKFNLINPDSILIMIGALPGKFAGDYEKYSEKVFDKMESLASKGVLFNFVDINPFPIIKRTNIHLFMSRYEGQGLAPIEFALFGIPTIGSSIPTNIEQSKEYGNIFIADSNPESICNCIVENINTRIEFDLGAYNNFVLGKLKENVYD